MSVSVSASKVPDFKDNKTRLENVRLVHPSLKFRKNVIFLASSGSFTVKNENIHNVLFSLIWLQILHLPA